MNLWYAQLEEDDTMKRTILVASMLAIPALAFAHVTVRPAQSKPGVEEHYTVRVPTEGQVATTSLQLDIPEGVNVTDVPAAQGVPPEVRKSGDRIVSIVWKKEIPPKQSAEFLFTARNPPGGEQITWQARQNFSDGTSRPWTPGTKLASSPAPAASAGQGLATGADTASIESWLKGYDEAFNAKDLDKLAAFYHPEVTVYEGGGINTGWADYRDHHLGPELKEFQNLQFGHSNTRVTMHPGGQSAYATSEYSIKAKMGEREIDSRGLETLVLVRGSDGNWKIRHSHTSSRPARRAAGQQG